MKTTITLEITHNRPMPDLSDLVANRIWSLEGVEDVTATIVPTNEKDEETINAEVTGA